MENEYKSKDEIFDAPVSEKKPKRATKKRRESNNLLLQIMHGDFLVKDFVVNNLGFVFFLFAMFIALISKGYYANSLVKNTDKTQNELDAKTAEYVESKAKLEVVTRRDVLVKRLSGRGLYETTTPAKVIRIKKEKK